MTNAWCVPPLLPRWLTVALLVVSLFTTLIGQVPRIEQATDESFGNAVVLQKKVSKDGAETLTPDTFLDDGDSRSTPVEVHCKSSCSTPLFLAADYLATFINAPSRAPPALA